MNKLKKCPFCKDGRKPKVDFIGHVHCPIPGIGEHCSRGGLTVEEWQSRPLEDALQKRIDELEAEIDRVAPFLAIHGVTGYKIVEEK